MLTSNRLSPDFLRDAADALEIDLLKEKHNDRRA